jgi:hypothetical protein|tara:strand:+ start:96 stop:1169 length:1074 start_codon:yes stop_codon:yes gene_type:complete
MAVDEPGLYGIRNSNRDFTQKNTWGKNQFNTSFPASLSSYLASKNYNNIYLTLNQNLNIVHSTLSTTDLFGLDPQSEDLFFSFESAYTPYEQLLIGNLPRVDLVTQNKNSGQALKPIEIKLTALPDNTTCELEENKYGTELVVRPDTIVYLACSIAYNFKNRIEELKNNFSNNFMQISDWTEGREVWPYLTSMVEAVDAITLSILERQEPILMQPIWKTFGKSPSLSENCLDVFVWSNFAFIQLFLNVVRGELSSSNRITRQIRTVIWLFKMLYDFANNGRINHAKIIDELSYNTKNDKAFAIGGKVTHPYMSCPELTKPRIRKNEIKNIILGGGENLLSPERRFDAIIYNTPELFK